MGKQVVRFLGMLLLDTAWALVSLGTSPREFFRRVALVLFLAFIPVGASTQDVRTYIPAGATTFAPLLAAQQRTQWAGAPEPWTLAGQVEKESCITLRHSKCWNPHAELKTSAEYGFGFGQTTVAFRADGSERFNKFDELKAQHSELRGWAWAERFDPGYQLKAFLLMSRDVFARVRDAATPTDRWAFALAGYNGGEAGTLKDRLLCRNTKGCDPARWFGNVERTSLKSRLARPGYGRSPFEINRAYPDDILNVRREKYRVFWGA